MARIKITREHFENGKDMSPVLFAQWRSTVNELAKARTRYLLILLTFIVLAFLCTSFLGGTVGNLLAALSLALGLIIAGMTTHTIRLNKDQKELQKQLNISQLDLAKAKKKAGQK